MVSRRKILSRSRDDLNLDMAGAHGEDAEESPPGGFRNNNFIEQEDVWFHKDKLYSVSWDMREIHYQVLKDEEAE